MAEQPETKVCVIKLRIGVSLVGPTKRMAKDLHAAAELYNQCRNAIVRGWERSAEDDRGDKFAMYVCRCGAEKRRAERKAAGEQKVRETCTCESNPCAIARRVTPLLAAKISTSCAPEEVKAKLTARVPWNHPRTNGSRYIWQAILANEASRPCYRGAEIPVPAQDARIELTDNGYMLRFPLWSEKSGRQHKSYTVRLKTRRMEKGYRRILMNIARGTWKLCGSKIHFHEPKSRRNKGYWAVHLAYHRPQERIAGLDPKSVAKLTLLGKDAKKPFEIATDGAFPRELGDVAVYLGVLSRLETRRIEMRMRHRDKGSGRRGHGRGRTEKAIRPLTRKTHGIARLFQWRIVSQVVAYCARYGCGVVEFNEPSQGKKNVCWFSAAGRQWDWTGFVAKLKHKLWANGIELREGEGGEPNAGGRSRSPKGDGDGGKGNSAVAGAAKVGAKRGVARKVKGK